MIFLISLIPTTALVVVGYFLVYTSTRAEGGLKRFGKYLGVWVFFLAGITILGGLLASTFGIQTPMGGMKQHMERMESHMEGMENMQKEQLAILQELKRN